MALARSFSCSHSRLSLESLSVFCVGIWPSFSEETQVTWWATQGCFQLMAPAKVSCSQAASTARHVRMSLQMISHSSLLLRPHLSGSGDEQSLLCPIVFPVPGMHEPNKQLFYTTALWSNLLCSPSNWNLGFPQIYGKDQFCHSHLQMKKKKS